MDIRSSLMWEIRSLYAIGMLFCFGLILLLIAEPAAGQYVTPEDIEELPETFKGPTLPRNERSFSVDPSLALGSRRLNQRIRSGDRVEIRIPVVFVDYSDAPAPASPADFVAKVEEFFRLTSYGQLNINLREKVISLPGSAFRNGGLPTPRYGVDGRLKNAEDYPPERDFTGHYCRFLLERNQPIVGDFNGDDYDDIGVKWVGGENEGKWVISLNQRTDSLPLPAESFDGGKQATVGDRDRAYRGDNIPIVGDFNGDGYDDIGVKWVGGDRDGLWTISLNERMGPGPLPAESFGVGQPAMVGRGDRAYVGNNIPIVGDFNGDGYDDIGVKWVGGDRDGLWTISLNERMGPGPLPAESFGVGQPAMVGRGDRAYVGNNIPIVGDFNGDGYDDIGVKWVGGDRDGLWTISLNERMELGPLPAESFDVGQPAMVGGGDRAYRGDDNIPIVGNFDGDGFDERDDIGVKWNERGRNGWWTISLNSSGTFGEGHFASINGNIEAYPQDLVGAVFKDRNGSEELKDNENVLRNYCQVAERNLFGDALRRWRDSNEIEFNDFMSWARATDSGPVVAYMTPQIPGGGTRNFQVRVGTAWPLEVGGLTFTDYLYSRLDEPTLAHEIGHFVGHGEELYRGHEFTSCLPYHNIGFLGNFDVMGVSNGFPAFNALTRWRFGFTRARYITRSSRPLNLTIPPDLNITSPQDSIVVIHPDPAGHPDELFVLENRRKVSLAVGGLSVDFNNLPQEGLFMYHVKVRNTSTGTPFLRLINDRSTCPRTLSPFQGALSSTSSERAYRGRNIPIVGDFNDDGYDDIGVKWAGGDRDGLWTISLNSLGFSFAAGQPATVGREDRAYVGNNIPIVGDFDGDGYDDIGVKWVGGDRDGLWTISLNERIRSGPLPAESFYVGQPAMVGGGDRAYVGNNIPIVGDFNGDGYDDIGVKWVGGDRDGLWTISLNERMGPGPLPAESFGVGQPAMVGRGDRAYVGNNIPIVGDFNGDGYDDIGVKWVGGDRDGLWTISLNQRTDSLPLPAESFGVGRPAMVGGGDRAYRGDDNIPIVGNFDGDGFDERDDIGVKWVGGERDGLWAISLNQSARNFDVGLPPTFGGGPNSRFYDGTPSGLVIGNISMDPSGNIMLRISFD